MKCNHTSLKLGRGKLTLDQLQVYLKTHIGWAIYFASGGRIKIFIGSTGVLVLNKIFVEGKYC